MPILLDHAPELDDGRALYVQGLLALRNGDADDAISLLTRALRRQPEHRGMRRNLVRASLAAEQYEQVLLQANAALAGTPDDAELHFARGTALNAWVPTSVPAAPCSTGPSSSARPAAATRPSRCRPARSSPMT